MSDDRRNPFDGVTDYFSELARMRTLGTHGTLPSAERAGEGGQRTHASAWVPATDILAVGDDLVIQLELPGVAADDVDLRLHHGVLTVSGSREAVAVPGDDGPVEPPYFVRERYVGEFRRSITLPDGTQPEDLSAEFADGLVEVRVAGAAQGPRSTRIAVADRSRASTRRPVAGPAD
ncbi:hypothetical protein GCM10009737_36830 [Nocardioides lentus]|uniref:SHSP domain-containing protein n=1 Tax=Nocardioides lentus TaxID=338077 RepID=A0ABP5B532_9ACTN